MVITTESVSPALTAVPACGDGDEPVIVYVRLNVRHAVTEKAMAALNALVKRHPEVAFSVAGLSRDARYVRVTLGVDFGPPREIARFGEQALAAYAFVQEVFETLYDHLPHMVSPPSEQEVEAVAAVRAGAAVRAAHVSPACRIPAAA